ncbi:MAG TPA: RIP metalloprotease RseP [Candidatus Atribacteria bacterium]|nr:RIP metalloprotease RseP [Candidatus Atribacteria bacterium]
MLTILATIFVIGLLVLCHEFGHFIFARWFKVRVLKFAIGYGPKLWTTQKGDTEYSIRAFPLGGFTKMAGMEETLIEGYSEASVPDAERFDKKPIYQRSLIVAGGPAMNLFLSIILVFLVFSFLGVPTSSLKIQQVIENSPAQNAGILPGDVITSVNGKTIEKMEDLSNQIALNGEQELSLTVLREQTQVEVRLTPRWDEDEKRFLIGIVYGVENRRVNPFVAFYKSVSSVIEWFVVSFLGLLYMVMGRVPMEVTGIIGIAQMSGQAASYGFLNLLYFSALISVALALFNLLPIPALDGGHLLLFLYEKIRGKPMDPSKIGFFYMIGFLFIVLMAIFVTYQDVLRIVAGK